MGGELYDGGFLRDDALRSGRSFGDLGWVGREGAMDGWMDLSWPCLGNAR